MNNARLIIGSVAVATVAVSAYSGWLYSISWLAVHLLVGFIGFYYTIQWKLVCGNNYKPQLPPKSVNAINFLVQKMMSSEPGISDQPRKVVISRSLDNTLQEVLDLITQSFIITWYQPLTSDKTFMKLTQAEMWRVIDRASRRMSEIDLVSFLSQDFVDCLHQHFANIRLAKRDTNQERTDEESKEFVLHTWLQDEETELACLRNIADVLLMTLTSKPYGQCAPIRHLLREIIAGSVLKPTIDMICDPDYINLKLLDYIAYREKMNADIKRTYMYSATYEGFMKMIQSSDSVNDLLQMRYYIISEILQASAINNLKKQQGLTTDKDVVPKNTNKGELLKARNLERYKKQLTVARQRCEKRIISLGGSVYENNGPLADKEEEIHGQKLFSFAVIMEMVQGREYFMKYLKKEGADSYLGFWEAVEKLKTASKDQIYILGSEIYQQYIVSSSSMVKVDKAVLKGMEEFLRGDKGPEAFVTAQKQVASHLEEQYYPSFIVSDTYACLTAAIKNQGATDDDDLTAAEDELFLDSNDHTEDEDSLIAGQSYHAQQRLRTLDNKITNKARALLAQRSSQKTEGSNKLKRVYEDMEQELENLKTERGSLEMHIARTQKWIDHIGQWAAHVYDASVITTEDDRKVAQFVLLVSLSPEDGERSQQPVSGSAEGWAISRTLEDFHALHERLSPIGSWLQKKELPSIGKNIFKTLDNAFVQKAKTLLDDYLKTVMQDERLIPSEALYAFLSPTPEFVYQPSANEKKSRFSSLMKSLPNIRSDPSENEDDFMFSEDSSKDEKSPDSIAKPLYRLVGEVFELQGMFRWFRKSLISFVELTFGRSIDKQLKDTVDWLVGEQMLIYYTQMFKDSLWPNGQWTETTPARSDSQKQEDRMQAKTKLMENMPDTLKSLVGEDNGRRGMIKIFEVLQNKTLNKHLFYNLFEIAMTELLPEMKKTRDRMTNLKLLQQQQQQKQEELERLQNLEQETDF